MSDPMNNDGLHDPGRAPRETTRNAAISRGAKTSLDTNWTLVERYVEHYPDDWRLVFRRGDEVLEISVPEEVWRAFDA